NATLLEFAAVEIDGPRLKQEIRDLMEGNFNRRGGRQRLYLSSTAKSGGNFDARLRVINGLPLQIRAQEFYRIWLNFRRYLGDWSANRRFNSEIMSELLDEIKVRIDRCHKAAKARYGTCAVVGNSGILLNQSHGALIDSHDAVIRLNNARIRSFERHVGSKTTVSFINSNILHLCARRPGCFCHPYGDSVPIVMYICQPIHFFDYLLCNSSQRAPILITDPQFDLLCARIVKYYSVRRFMRLTGNDSGDWNGAHDGANFHYSSGMQAVMLAVGMCERVSVFGFGKGELGSSSRHHYHTSQKAELSLHDYEAEYEFYRDLIERPEMIPFISGGFKPPVVVMYR
ncbi:hypothetical protein M569_03312, partial [Genlisea aurea]